MSEATVIRESTAQAKRMPSAQPCTLVILGASGDLARRKLIPALYNLQLDGVLPRDFAVIGVGRTDLGDDAFRATAKEGVLTHSRRPPDVDSWKAFVERLYYISGDVETPSTYQAIRTRAEEIEARLNLSGNRIFYLAIPPTSIAEAAHGLRNAGLTGGTEASDRFARVIVEKPIGRDLASALEINRVLNLAFHESQIYRIDHYLGKETVQNLLVLRFANGLFEPLWNHKYIDHIQISVAEDDGIGSRASYYEQAGALRDMVQNHILQLLCLVAMEPPWSLDSDVVRNARLAVLRSLRPIRGQDVNDLTVRGQYSPAMMGTSEVPGYRRESGVKPDSTTETYVALKAFVDNWRWAGVPFYIRTGKRMAKRATEISVQFKEVPPVLFNADPAAPLEPNVLSLRIQPEEGFSLRMNSKRPGSRVSIEPVSMQFRYGAAFGALQPEAYERLLLDVMAGDATLFMRRDSVEAAWEWVTAILDGWRDHGTKWLPEYEAGTCGPLEADRLIERDGRRWHSF